MPPVVQCEVDLYPHRAVAAGSVCLVSTGSHFPSHVACLVSPISAIARRMPTQDPQACRWHIEPCEMAVNVREFFRVFLPKTFSILPIERLVLQASSAKGVACEVNELLESQNQCCMTQWAERVDIHTCETLCLASEKYRIGLMASKFQNFRAKYVPRPP